jgi:hypothetical protein
MTDWREANAELLARPHNKKRMIINHRLVREGDGNADEIFALEAALHSPDWRGGRLAACDRLDRLVYKPKQTVILPGDGDPCPECSMPTEIREHVAITEKLLAQPRYSSRWFLCRNWRCGTIIFPECFEVVRTSSVDDENKTASTI